MLFAYIGSDRNKAREELRKAAEAAARKAKARIIRITDAHGAADMHSALDGAGLFVDPRVVVLDGVLASEDLRALVLASLEYIARSHESVFLLEEAVDAPTRRLIEKYAENVHRYDTVKKKDDSIFALARALERGDKKMLWILLEKQFLKGAAAEAIHGVLFWGAKQALLAARGVQDIGRYRKLVAELAELPHESRRSNFPLEYALLRFALSLAR